MRGGAPHGGSGVSSMARFRTQGAVGSLLAVRRMGQSVALPVQKELREKW